MYRVGGPSRATKGTAIPVAVIVVCIKVADPFVVLDTVDILVQAVGRKVKRESESLKIK